MNYFNTASSGIKLVEKGLMIIVLVSIIFKYTVDYNATIDLLVACFLLSLFYFPFGFYFLGKPWAPSIFFGLIYALAMAAPLAMAALLLGLLKVHNYEYPLFTIFLFLLGISGFLYRRLKSGIYAKEFVYANFFRMIFILVINLIVLVFRF